MILALRFYRYFLFFPCILALTMLFMCYSPYRELDVFLSEPYSIRFYDRNGRLLQITPLENGMRREFISIDEIKPAVIDVFLLAEDSMFFAHCGFNPLSITRALFQNITSSRRISGASTITMQLARLIARRGGNVGPSWGAKIKELYNALRLECRFSKKQILEMYLNTAPFGLQTEGFASAARNFFAASPDSLSPAAVFALAVIPRRPADYNPLENPENCLNAARQLQERFASGPARRKHYPLFSHIEEADWQFTLKNARKFRYPFEAPHIVRFVSRQWTAKPVSELYLSIDLGLEHTIEAALRANTARYYDKRLSTGAAIVLDNVSGEILAWVGSADFQDRAASGQVDGVLALNQPGSSMKPFLYALALEQGMAPATVFADVPREFGTEALYIPQNFNNRFNGPILMRQALASSLNIPAVDTLYQIGQKNYADFLFSLGFQSLRGETGAESAGLGLALGNAPVSLLELARAFSIFPNDGRLMNLRFMRGGGYFSQETGTDHAFLPTPTQSGVQEQTQLISPDSARIIASFLSDPHARVLAFGRAKNFRADFPVIFKTGTANQYQSIVALAASRSYTIAVWMGNFSGETIIGKTGSSVPATIARDALVYLHRRNNALPQAREDRALDFLEPENFEKSAVCALSGMRPGPACLSVLYEYTKKTGETAAWSASPQNPNKSSAHFTVREAAQHPLCTWHSLENGISVIHYPAEYQSWFLSSKRDGEIEHHSARLSITSPRDGFLYFLSPSDISRAEIPVEISGGSEDTLELEYDGLMETLHRPFTTRLPAQIGQHSLTVRCGDEKDEIIFHVE
ncbi:MAG: transglycosylase domain-containing protein [Spirochaetaceae bacterium]|jgi:penicillin-binding protein 1C|nr:transglycosylase domain-containing protein [Spirochaetaceae bacterium]